MSGDTPLKILIAEDNDATAALLVKFLQKQGHTLRLAKDGQKALDLFHAEQPDLVLTDINMPVINGLEFIRQIRRLHSETWVPIIILSAYNQEDDIVNGLEAGADDYMIKPLNLKILIAKIKSLRHFINLQKINQQTTSSLAEAHDALENEQMLAKSLFDKMLDLGDLTYPGLQYWLCPSAQFSGDLITATRTVDQKLYLMLADATGHGLAAALPILLIARTFHAMSDKGYALPSILVEMNRTAKKYLTTYPVSYRLPAPQLKMQLKILFVSNLLITDSSKFSLLSNKYNLLLK
ncbi:MAG: response regulator [Gammaproteobacteria bacterium]